MPDLNDTFLKYLKEEQATMDSPEFKRLIAGRDLIPEMVS